nr:uncharacterized protein LOC127346943 [Lolium perenne]
MAPPSPPPFFLLARRVATYPPGHGIPQGHPLTSESKIAFGFEDQDEADSMVRTMELRSHLPDTDLASVTLHGGHNYSSVNAADNDLILIASACPDVYPPDILLIYDAIDSSLRVIPSSPYSHPPISTNLILVARRDDDEDDRSYALVSPGTVRQQHVLFLFLSTSNSASPWHPKKASFPDHWLPDDGVFEAREVFSFRGRGYWVDLLCGVLYCDCSQVLSDDIDCVDIRSLDLPPGCKMCSGGDRDEIARVKAFRAMGPVGDSIKFVSIDGYLEHADLNDCKVRLWTLMADTTSWALEYELKFVSLSEFKGDYVPPEMAPMYPFLSTHEDNVIYFALGNVKPGRKTFSPDKPCCMLRVDLHRKIVKVKKIPVLQSMTVASYLAVSGNVAHKLLAGSCQLSHVEDLNPCPADYTASCY